jgi:hypothetical protein
VLVLFTVYGEMATDVPRYSTTSKHLLLLQWLQYVKSLLKIVTTPATTFYQALYSSTRYSKRTRRLRPIRRRRLAMSYFMFLRTCCGYKPRVWLKPRIDKLQPQEINITDDDRTIYFNGRAVPKIPPDLFWPPDPPPDPPDPPSSEREIPVYYVDLNGVLHTTVPTTVQWSTEIDGSSSDEDESVAQREPCLQELDGYPVLFYDTTLLIGQELALSIDAIDATTTTALEALEAIESHPGPFDTDSGRVCLNPVQIAIEIEATEPIAMGCL